MWMQTFDMACKDICNDNDTCKWLTECHFDLSAILNVFSYLKNNNHVLSYFCKIEQHILEIKDLLTL